ncbi:MAG TPA: sugar ABC transporter ATP-binding protein [Burkholderiaceae bacterium]|nr:sugar ABC transporter ATP-binding protein [Burkholderiaceae bacterium]
MNAPLVEIRGLEKEFSGTRVLKGVDLDFLKGEVHGLLGENGAGKSTLIKIMTGVYSPSAGEIRLDGHAVKIGSPLDAHKYGLGAVYQDAELVSSFTVAQNVVLGNEPGAIAMDQKRIRAEAQRILQEIGIDIDVDRRAASLSAAEMQLVTLATLFHRKYKLIILDEPTARLSGTEVELLFKIMQRFGEQGITIIYISHRLNEIKRVCDRVTILRGGLVSATLLGDEITEDRVTELMIDRSRSDLETYNEGVSRAEIAMEVEGLATPNLLPLSFKLKAGEVLGITGPVGGGMEQIEQALGGIVAYSGKVTLKGRVVSISSPTDARRAGIAVIPEDRRKQALFPNLSLADNVCMPVLRSLERLGYLMTGRKAAYASGIIDRLTVKPNLPLMPIKYFSGGNQQKAVIGKWMSAKADVYIFVEPTSGVDVGAIKEIYDIILQMAHAGAAVIVISSSVKEILSLAETVFVIHDKELTYASPKKACTYDQLLAISMKGREKKAA